MRKVEAFCKERKELNRSLFFTMSNEGEEMVGGFERFKKLLAKQAPKHFVWDAMYLEDEDHGSAVLLIQHLLQIVQFLADCFGDRADGW